MTESRLKYLPTILALGVLGGLMAETLARPKPKDAEPYHRAVRAAVEGMAKVIGDWEGSDGEPTGAAVALLRPNVILERHYVNRRTGRAVNFLLVHCKDARDMAGHYPPNCYPGQGWELKKAEAAGWEIKGQRIEGKEYEFVRTEMSQPIVLVVYNLMILPNGALVGDMDEVRKAAADYLRQFFGAAQIQVVMDGSIPADERQEIFRELIGANMAVLQTLRSGGTR